MGSGSLNAMAMFEAGYKDNMTKEEAMALVASAIRSGVLNDLGSGSNIDLCIINKEGTEYLRNYEYLQAKTYQRVHPVIYAPGTTRELTECCDRLPGNYSFVHVPPLLFRSNC